MGNDEGRGKETLIMKGIQQNTNFSSRTQIIAIHILIHRRNSLDYA
jgi:hypothetical protein